jgi:hypothetical protein
MSTNYAQLDPSVLAGITPPQQPIDNTQVPMAPAGGASPSVPAQSSGPAPAPPDVGPTGPQGQAPPVPGQPAAPQAPPPAQGTPSVWKDLVYGALSGLAGSSGRGGFANGLAEGARGYQAQKQQDFQNQQASQKQAADIQFQSLQAAHLVAQTRYLSKQVLSWDEDHQADFFNKNSETAKNLQALGLNPDYVTANDHDSEVAAMKDATAKQGGVPPTLSLQIGKDSFVHFNLASPQIQGDVGMKTFNDQQQRLGQPAISDADWAKLTPQQRIGMVHDAATEWQPTNDPQKLANMKNDLAAVQNLPDDGSYKKQDSIAQLNKSIATSEALMKSNPLPKSMKDKLDQSTIDKNEAEAAKARNDANQQSASEWKPKVSADEKKRAELAENLAENANAINGILARRPDLVGKLAGRISQGAQYTGTDDKDLTALEARVQNFGKANAGVHALRSYEGVKDTEQAILNSYKNGPQGIAGALGATVDSAQTFIDDSRPEGYPTHSKNGGALNYYAKRGGGGQAQNFFAQHGGQQVTR